MYLYGTSIIAHRKNVCAGFGNWPRRHVSLFEQIPGASVAATLAPGDRCAHTRAVNSPVGIQCAIGSRRGSYRRNQTLVPYRSNLMTVAR